MDEDDEEYEDGLEGAPERKVLDRLALGINRRLAANNDYWMAITGPEGSGKSSLAMKIAKAVDDKFTVERNVVVNPTVENVLELIIHSDVKAIVIDEAVNIAYNKEHFKSENIFFTRLSAVCRKKNKFIILCIPRMRSLDSALRNHRLRSWIFVPERGTAVVMVPNVRNPFCSDPWYLKTNEKWAEKGEGRAKVADISTGHEINVLKGTKTYWFHFRFTKLDELTEHKYKELVAKLGKEIVFRQDKPQELTELPPKTKYKIYKDGEIPALPANYRV
jgi:ABC-type dipeptide/oligopeptide/nickel transport system ATPase component